MKADEPDRTPPTLIRKESKCDGALRPNDSIAGHYCLTNALGHVENLSKAFDPIQCPWDAIVVPLPMCTFPVHRLSRCHAHLVIRCRSVAERRIK